MSRVDELKDRLIQMIDQGCTRFGWSPGPKWHSLSIEEKADAILTAWDAVTVQDGPPISRHEPTDISQVVAEIDAGHT